MRRRRAPWQVQLLTAILIVASCGSTTPPPQPSGTGTPPRPTSDATAQSSANPTPTSSLATTGSNVPADIAADVDALLAATTQEAAVAATRTILEKSGVVIADDPTTVTPTPAGIYLSTLELEMLAHEARSSTSVSRITLSDFALTFGALAGLPPNQGLLEGWSALDFSIPLQPPASPSPDASPNGTAGDAVYLQADSRSYPAHFAKLLTTWVDGAAALHTAAEPEGVALSNPPLYLQAFAERQLNPIDLRRSFAPGELQLGTLQLTLLIAGIRANVAWAQADLDAAAAPLIAGAVYRPGPPIVDAADAQGFSDCDQLKQLIDAHVPLSPIASLGGKTFIKNMIKGFIDGLFGAGTSLREYVGPAFKALGLLFKVAALVLLYEHADADLRLEPGFIHKPTGDPELAAAIVEAGIPDHEWERAKQERENDFWSTALRTCARFLGVPVPSDLIDVGQATEHWAVQWEITRGLNRHAYLHQGEMYGPGVVAQRLERPLQRLDDHTGTDTLLIDVLPEKQADHPGIEYSDPVTVCARVVPREPPGGFKTFLSAGFAGSSLASGGLSSLAALIGELLTSFYRELATIDACESMNVSYHVPQPMPWRGRIKVNWESREHTEQVVRQTTGWGTGPQGEPLTTVGVQQTDTDITTTYYVGGMDDPNFSGHVSLTGIGYTQGVQNYFDYEFRDAWSAMCQYRAEKTDEGGGGWSFNGQAMGALELSSDGRYTIRITDTESEPTDIQVPGNISEEITIVQGDCFPTPEGGPSGRYPLYTRAPYGVDEVGGQLDPQKPGEGLAGSETYVWDDGSVTTIEWELTHDGPIRLPQ